MSVALSRAVDTVATADPGGGYGYADSQHAWHHDPAIDLPRATWLGWLGQVQAVAPHTIVQIGGDPRSARGGRARALRLLAPEVVTRDDGEALPVACDVLLLDADDAATAALWWARHAPSVRDGGLVAVVDRGQDGRRDPPDQGWARVERFVHELAARVLTPHGASWLRAGQATCVHSYVQQPALRRARRTRLRVAAEGAAAAPLAHGERHGFACVQHAGRWFAVPADGPPFTARSIAHNRHAVVLVAPDEPALHRLVLAWRQASGGLAAARAVLPQDVGRARAAVAAVAAAWPGLGPALVCCVEQAPWCRELLLALGMLWLFGQQPRAGAALLRRAAEQGLDGDLTRVVATAYLQVLGDEPGARRVFAAVQREVRRRQVAAVCRALPRGHVLWDYPEVLSGLSGVLEVGAGAGENVATWTRLGLSAQCFVEAEPGAVAALRQAVATAGAPGARVLPFAVGARAGPGTLHCALDGGSTSLLAADSLATRSLATPPRPTRPMPVAVTTLDDLVADGQIDPRHFDLLVIDAGGAELDVLRGAVGLLRHVDVVCVTVWLQPVHDGAPLPEQVQAFLRELPDDGAFTLRAFEPGPDPARGTALYRRQWPVR